MFSNSRIFPNSVDQADAVRVLGRAQASELGPNIRLLVWNIYKARRSNWLSDFNDLVCDRDLVLLQEAVVNAPSDALFGLSERCEWIMACSHQQPGSGVITGVKTGCVATVDKQRVHRSRHTEPVVKTQKLLLETHYKLADSAETLMVLNMHAINFVGVKKYVDQLEQLSYALGHHSGPVILAGDFNTWSPKRLAHFKDRAERADLIEASMTRRSKVAHLNQHLDHVFFRGLCLTSVESMQQIRSSDHAPIMATLTLSPAH